MTKKRDLSFKPNWCMRPGVHIQEYLDYNGWTQAQLANKMRRPHSQVNRMIRGKIRITPETAIELSHVFRQSAEFWMNLETNYRLGLLRGQKDVSDD